MSSLAAGTRVSRRAQGALLNHRWSRRLPSQRLETTLRIGAGLGVLGFLGWRLGTGPFLDGLRATEPWAVLVAVVATAGTTWCVALRWSLLSARFGERVPLRTAYAAYYRSQLVNATVPGGVVGDLHRGARHGWRGVLWDRVLGQAVQLGLVGALVLPGPWRWVGLSAVALLVAAGGRLLVLSALSTAGHLVVFVVAAQLTTGSLGQSLPLGSLLALGALVLLGSSIPRNVAGWGPREGVAAWAFAAYGSTAATGVAVSVTFGVLGLVATLPGLLTLGRRHG